MVLELPRKTLVGPAKGDLNNFLMAQAWWDGACYSTVGL